MRVVFDVGANDGGDTLDMARNDPDTIVYAFEPTPQLAEKLRSYNLPNYVVIEKAVSNYEGMTQFHVSENGDWGTSSMNKFNDNLEKTWPGREDFKVTKTIDVEVTTLRKFIIDNNIQSIDYLHIDAQGQDLEVLIGLKEKLKIVKKGVVEMPLTHAQKLYKDQKFILEDAVNFLMSHYFLITKIRANDPGINEVNVYFDRIQSFKIEDPFFGREIEVKTTDPV